MWRQRYPLPSPAGVGTRGTSRSRPTSPLGRPEALMAIATQRLTVETFVIEGGRPLRGTVTPAGNKNAALPILAACLLTAEPVTLHNVPRIRDVEAMVELVHALGVDAEW